MVLSALAWLTLWIWSNSHFSGYLGHQELGSLDSISSLPLLALVFLAGWTLMMVGMMMPTSFSFFSLFARQTAKKRNRRRLLFSVIAGYLSAWIVFGFVLYINDYGIHSLVKQVPILGENTWVIGVGALVLAGVYQFAPIKQNCLAKCRSPASLIEEKWSTSHGSMKAAELGLRDSLYSIGCSWTIMLLMFSVGLASIEMMLLLGTIMAIEKNTSSGPRFRIPIGIAFLGSSVALAAGLAIL